MENLIMILTVFAFVILIYLILSSILQKHFDEQKKKNEEESKRLFDSFKSDLEKLQKKNKEDIKDAIEIIAKFYSSVLIDCDEEILSLLEQQENFCEMFSKIKEIIIAKNKFENAQTLFPAHVLVPVTIEIIKKETEKTKNEIFSLIAKTLQLEISSN